MKHLSLFENFNSIINFESEILPILKEKCKPFLDELIDLNKKSEAAILSEIRILYRGSKKNFDEPIIKIKPRKDRKPLTTNKMISDLVDEYSLEEFGWKFRSNGVFTTFDKPTSSVYGNPYIFIPIGDYKYAYNPKISDLYVGLSKTSWYFAARNIEDIEDDKEREQLKKDMHSGIKSIVNGYKTDLSKGDDARFEDLRGKEIQFNCDEYFLLKTTYVNQFKQYIKNEMDKL